MLRPLCAVALLAAAACAGDMVVGSAPAENPEAPAGGEDDTAEPSDAPEPPPPPSPDAAPTFACSGAGIAAFADRLVERARGACLSDGIGVVTNTNYECLRGPIYELAPPFPAAAWERVSYWAVHGNNYSGLTTRFQCVDFAFVVTAGVCGHPINAGDAQIDTNLLIPGYTYHDASAGTAEPGDVLVMDGHIAVTAEVIGHTHLRVSEANYLYPDGSTPTTFVDTGVISNTRIDTLGDPWILGWYRKQP